MKVLYFVLLLAVRPTGSIIIIYSRGDIREVEFRLDKEGKEFHHFEEFAKMYRAEVGKIIMNDNDNDNDNNNDD